jgi:mRNA-degrading endonuclease RelE of RelBE toxin-antitoxin system
MRTIEFTAKGRKSLRSLALTDQRGITSFLLERVAPRQNPRAFAKRLNIPGDELWRFRVSDSRIIVRFIDDKMEILVIEAGTAAKSIAIE